MNTAIKIEPTVSVKQLLAVVKGADHVSLHGQAAYGRESYSDAFTFEVRATRRARKGSAETSTTLEVNGYAGNGSTSEKTTHGEGRDRWQTYAGHYKPTRGFWWLFGAQDRLIDLLEVLPQNAEIMFEVRPDAGTNEYLIRAKCEMNYETYEGLHADHLYLTVRYIQRGRIVRRSYLVDTSTQPHNTARFGVYT